MKKIISLIFVFILTLSCVACNPVIRHKDDPTETEEAPTVIQHKDDPAAKEVASIELPPDFSFSIEWGLGTMSNISYDSKTGKFVMTQDALMTDVSKYTAYVKMSESELKQVYAALCQEIHIQDYPEVYDVFPDEAYIHGGDFYDEVIISVTANGQTYSVSCYWIPLWDGEPDSEKAKAFYRAYGKVIDLITSFPEWEAFPDLGYAIL